MSQKMWEVVGLKQVGLTHLAGRRGHALISRGSHRKLK